MQLRVLYLTDAGHGTRVMFPAAELSGQNEPLCLTESLLVSDRRGALRPGACRGGLFRRICRLSAQLLIANIAKPPEQQGSANRLLPRAVRALKSIRCPVEADEMAQNGAQGAQAEFLTVYFCTNGVGTLYWVNSNVNSPGSLRSSSTS